MLNLKRPWGVVADVRYALRSLRRNPALSVVAIGSLALGIGANSAMFRVIDAVLLRPPPLVQAPDGIARIYLHKVTPGGSDVWASRMSYPLYMDLRRANQTFAGLGASWQKDITLGEGAAARSIHAVLVSSNYFELLGVAPQLGHFSASASGRDDGAEPIVMLSHEFWVRTFAANRAILGTTIRLNGRRFTITGIAPEQFRGLEPQRVDVWLPMGMASHFGFGSDMLESRSMTWLQAFGRLKAGLTRDAAAADLSRVLAEVDDRPVRGDAPLPVVLGPINAAQGPERSPELKVSVASAAVTAIILLIACANVASLLIARALQRRREIAIRLATGASRVRLLRQLLTESMVLALVSGTAGLLLAAAGNSALRVFRLASLPSILSGRVLIFSYTLAVVTGLVFGLAPALQAAYKDQITILRDGTGGSVQSTVRIRHLLVALQIALSYAMLVLAAAFILGFRDSSRTETGYDVERLLVASIDGLNLQQFQPHERDALVQHIRDRAIALPGVRSVGLGSSVPFGFHVSVPVWSDTPSASGSQPLEAALNVVDTSYFAAAGIAIHRGRGFTAMDREGGMPVAVVNEAFARAYSPATDAIGQCLHYGGSPEGCTTVVGVVRDTKVLSLTEAPAPSLYLPAAQRLPGVMSTLLIQLDRPATAHAANRLRRELQGAAPNLPYVEVRPFSALIEPQLRPWRLGSLTFTAFGALALCLAMVGLYGVVAYVVTTRQREFGIRLALGASLPHLGRIVLHGSLMATLVGCAVGSVGSLLALRLISHQITGLESPHGVVFIAVTFVLVIATLLASGRPVWRVSKIDPSASLRAE